MEVLQTSALPLGDGAVRRCGLPASAGLERSEVERETGFEPATSTLARSHSTTELFPPAQTKERTTADPALARRAPFCVLYNPIAPSGRAPIRPPPNRLHARGV